MKHRTASSLAAAVVLAVGAFATAADAQTVLRMNNWLPPGHSQLVGVMLPWAKQVEEATKGRVKVVMTDTSLGAPQRQYDLAVDGIADVTLAIGGYTPGRFNLPTIANLPLFHDSGESRSVGLWRTYKAHFEKANEFKDVQVMGMYISAPGNLQTSRAPITDLASYKGKKMRVGGGVADDVNVALGGVNVSVPANSMYQVLQQGVVDGTMMGGEGYASFKLTGLIKYATLIPGGIYASDWYIVMNQASWNKLSKEDQAGVMSVSGENIARLGGRTFDAAEEAGRKQWVTDKVNIIQASPEFVKDIREKTAFLREKWLADAAKLNVDGPAALKMFEDEAKGYKPATN